MRASLAVLLIACHGGEPAHRDPVPPPPAPAPAPADAAEASCPPLTFALDGKPITPAVIFARSHERSGALELVIANKPLTCDDMLAPSRPYPDDEISAEVIVKGTSTAIALEQVVWDNDIEDSHPRLVGEPPRSKGDPAVVCFPMATLHGAMSHHGHSLTFGGLASGTYCGAVKL